MKIVHLMGYFIPELGYQEYYLAKKHVQMGHEVHVIASDLLYPFPNVESMLREAGVNDPSAIVKKGVSKKEGMTVWRLGSLFTYSDFVVAKGFEKTIAQIKPDVVFAHESRQGLPALAARYKKKYGYRLIVDQHDFYHDIPNHPFVKKVLRMLEYSLFRRHVVNFSLKRADRIVAVTNETKKFLMDSHHIDGSKIVEIPLGVDTDLFRFDGTSRAAIRKQMGAKDDDVVFVFSGTIVRRKGLEILLEALASIKGTKARLWIVGSGDLGYMDELKKKVQELGLKDQVKFVGFVKKERIAIYFSGADVGVWPGNNSVSILEAMACRLPIVMVDLQLGHLVKFGNGMKFSQNDEKGLAESIRKLTADTNLRREMSKKSEDAVKKEYSYDSIAKRFLELAK